MLTVELMRRGAYYFPERTAVLFADKSLTFAEVDRLSNQFAHVLADCGMKRGSRLAILANNSLYSLPVDFACVKAGTARTPLNSRLSIDEHWLSAPRLFDLDWPASACWVSVQTVAALICSSRRSPRPLPIREPQRLPTTLF
jgi:acyl-CoA synthetase (AMP-forming)/AMP-acid ligase II